MQVCFDLAKCINALGLCFDFGGALYVAYEVTNQFQGNKYKESSAGAGVDPPPTETEEYKQWELTKYKKMRIGLILLGAGFALQLISDLIP